MLETSDQNADADKDFPEQHLLDRDSRCRVIAWHLCMIDEETVPDSSASASYSAVKLPFELAAQEAEESRGQEDSD
ncbi:hypothetical protein Q8A67_024430 [Cirrhinus molitorella]|uniref:Uncharacterized protein n=1 Tax=Cirrhinus molitorella TaxID=172907 RepID=A0AA88PCH7_9TELE|nr:hypothetical protein Q8A67_024430 [Cirrhinus molitorella]